MIEVFSFNCDQVIGANRYQKLVLLQAFVDIIKLKIAVVHCLEMGGSFCSMLLCIPSAFCQTWSQC